MPILEDITAALPYIITIGGGISVLIFSYTMWLKWKDKKASKGKMDINLLEEHIFQANQKLADVNATLKEFNEFILELREKGGNYERDQ